MSHQPFDRNSSGIVFFTNGGTEPVYDSDPNFILATGSPGYIQAPNLRISNGGKIGSVGATGAIDIASNGNVTFNNDVSVAGSLVVNGTLTSVNTDNIIVKDPLILLSSGNAANTNDIGFFGQYSTSNYLGLFSDASDSNKFKLFTGLTAVPTTTVNTGGGGYTVGTLVANLEGNVTGNVTGNSSTATTLQNSRFIGVSGMMTGSGLFNGSADQVPNITAHHSLITAQTAAIASNSTDEILIASGTSLRKITRSNFVSGLGAMSSFIVSDGSTTETINDGNTLLFRSGAAINFTVSATDSVSGTLNAAVAGNGLTMSNQILNVGAGAGITVAADTVAVTAGSGITVNTNGVHVVAGTGLLNTTAGLQIGIGNGITGAADAISVTDGSGILVNAGGVHANLVTYATQGEAAQGATSTASRTYAVQVNGSDQLVVNVPWADTNTTYTAGTGLSLNGTVFNLASSAAGSGLVIDANGLHVNTDNSTLEVSVDTVRIKDDGVTNAKLRNSAAVSVIGRSANSIGDPADIAAGTDNQVLRRSGTTLGFGAINLASSDAVTGRLAFSNLTQGAATSVLGVAGGVTADVASVASTTDGQVLRRASGSLAFGTVATAGLADGSVTEEKRFRDVVTLTVGTAQVVSVGDILLCNAASGPISISSLPAHSEGKIIRLKKTDSTTNTVTISVNLDSAPKILYSQYESLTIVSDGSNWHII